MNNEWIIDVLADLRQYALKNYYIGLAEQLDDAIVMAAAEVRVSQDETMERTYSETDAVANN